MRVVPFLFFVGALALGGCDTGPAEPDPTTGGANPAYAGRFVGTWAEEMPDANFTITLFLVPEQGRMGGTGSVTRRLVVGGGFDESSFPLVISGRVAEDQAEPDVEINAQFPTGQLLVVRGVGEATTVINARLVGATPYGGHTVDEITLFRD